MTIYNVTSVNAKCANTKSFLTEDEAREYFNMHVSKISKCENVADSEKISENIFRFNVFGYSVEDPKCFIALTTSEL
jgi:hypothetical protein